MFFVCAFGSCLDVAAIQADMEDPIDFDAELTTAGKPLFEHFQSVCWCQGCSES